MCNPAAAMLAISAVSAAASYEQQQKSANQQQAIINAGDALEKGRLRTQMEQQNENAQEQQGSRTLEAIKEEGRLRAIGAETGLFGTSYDRSAQMVENSRDTDLAAIETSRLRANDQTGAEARAQSIQTRNQMNGIRRPSRIGTGLQIAGAGASYAAQQPTSYGDPTPRKVTAGGQGYAWD